MCRRFVLRLGHRFFKDLRSDFTKTGPEESSVFKYLFKTSSVRTHKQIMFK